MTMAAGEQADSLLDYFKAFDKGPYKRHLQKPEFYGIRGHTINWIESYLSCRTQQVIKEGRM